MLIIRQEPDLPEVNSGLTFRTGTGAQDARHKIINANFVCVDFKGELLGGCLKYKIY
jgi:hypothetical protein